MEKINKREIKNLIFKREKKLIHQSPRFKIFGKMRLGSKLSLDLIYYKTGLIFYLADFNGRNKRIPVFFRKRLNIEPYSPLKPTKVGFIFIGPNSFSRANDLAAVNHVT